MTTIVKFDFTKLFNQKQLCFYYITIFDIFILSIYVTFINFNKYIYFGPEAIIPFSNTKANHLDFSNCLSIITINSNNHILIDDYYEKPENLENIISGWNIHSNSFVIQNF